MNQVFGILRDSSANKQDEKLYHKLFDVGDVVMVNSNIKESYELQKLIPVVVIQGNKGEFEGSDYIVVAPLTTNHNIVNEVFLDIKHSSLKLNSKLILSRYRNIKIENVVEFHSKLSNFYIKQIEEQRQNISYERGRVVEIDFFSDETLVEGYHPAIIINGNRNDLRKREVTVVPLTSNKDRAAQEESYLIEKSNVLKNDSVALLSRINSIKKERINASFGILEEKFMKDIDVLLKKHLVGENTSLDQEESVLSSNQEMNDSPIDININVNEEKRTQKNIETEVDNEIDDTINCNTGDIKTPDFSNISDSDNLNQEELIFEIKTNVASKKADYIFNLKNKEVEIIFKDNGNRIFLTNDQLINMAKEIPSLISFLQLN